MAAQSQPKQSNLWGISFMLLHVLGLAVLYAVVKSLTQELNSNLVVFLYKFSILICILPWCLWGGVKTLKTKKIWLHASRGFFSIGASLSLFYAIKHIDLSDITAVIYLEQVILLIVGIIYFKEAITKTKIGVVIASFLGALIIIYPSMIQFDANYVPSIVMNKNIITSINPFYGFVFLAMVFWTANGTVIKILGKTEKTKVQMFYVMLFSSIIAFPLAFFEWQHITVLGSIDLKHPIRIYEWAELGLRPEHTKYIALLAACYFAHGIGFFKALKHAELSVVIPFEYARLVFAGLLGYFFFQEVPGTSSYIGYALIIGAGIFLVKSERRKHKKKKLREAEQLKLEAEHEMA